MSDRYIDGQISDIILDAISKGEAYRTGTLFTGVADTNTKQVVLGNGNADQALLVADPTIAVSGQVFAQKTKNVTIDTEGDAIPIINKRTDDNGTGNITAVTAGDNETGAVSGGTVYPQVNIGSGTNPSNAAAGGVGDAEISEFIYPTDTLTIGFENQAGSTIDASISLDIIRVPVQKL